MNFVDRLERQQIWIYLAAVIVGGAAAMRWPATSELAAGATWPLLAALLFATFVATPLRGVSQALRDRRFVAAALLGNFVLIPLGLALLWPLLPADPALRLGALLVLLVPCTDWFIAFARQGGGDVPRAVLITPLNLLLQILLLPVYLWLFVEAGERPPFAPAPLLFAFAGVILLPLALAGIVQQRTHRHPAYALLARHAPIATVPLLAAVISVVAAAQVGALPRLIAEGPRLVLLYAAFVVVVVLLAQTLGSGLRLTKPATRTLAFSFATRNSFVVLPVALALPVGWDAAAVAVVLQSLVELCAMALLVHWLPRHGAQ